MPQLVHDLESTVYEDLTLKVCSFPKKIGQSVPEIEQNYTGNWLSDAFLTKYILFLRGRRYCRDDCKEENLNSRWKFREM